MLLPESWQPADTAPHVSGLAVIAAWAAASAVGRGRPPSYAPDSGRVVAGVEQHRLRRPVWPGGTSLACSACLPRRLWRRTTAADGSPRRPSPHDPRQVPALPRPPCGYQLPPADQHLVRGWIERPPRRHGHTPPQTGPGGRGRRREPDGRPARTARAGVSRLFRRGIAGVRSRTGEAPGGSPPGSAASAGARSLPE